MVGGFAAFADDAESVVLHYGGAADAAKEALLHAAVEAEDCDFWGRLGGGVSLGRRKRERVRTISTSTGTWRKVTQGMRTLGLLEACGSGVVGRLTILS